MKALSTAGALLAFRRSIVSFDYFKGGGGSARLQHVIDLQLGAIGRDRPDADGDDAVEPGVFLRAGFEDGRGAEVELRGGYRFAAGNAVHGLHTAGDDAA